ncbi:transglutaminase family protein [Aestuariibacter salexigens]|uniref:transglutaminase family protein n=1 Tax=Aestuariibacter salexigens TaxID=226010 RepID=UPI0004181A4A|nr:transglutaminase family protein [Aestuariibacter salexigens]
MKRFNVVHQTNYAYPYPVQMQAHTLRLRPREGHDQHIESSQLTISPEANLRWIRDVESNSIAVATFTEPTDHLWIETVTIVQKYDESPYDFLIADDAVSYPFSYPLDDKVALTPYFWNALNSDPKHLDKWVKVIWIKEQPIQTFELLLLLNRQIYESIRYVKRDEEGVQSSSSTLKSNQGSCRDLANLFIDTARYLGFAARFVSGYVYIGPNISAPGTTHAWAEVYIPGAGWKGFDPTHGTLVGVNHIAVSVSLLPEHVPPVSGAFWGLPDANLEVSVWVTEIH